MQLTDELKSIQYRDYQNRIVDKTVNHFINNIPSVGIASPTGSGKTICALRILQWLADNRPDYRVNWVAMRRNLLRQAAKANNDYFGLKNIRFVSMFDKDPPKAEVIVIDELQHSATESFNHVSNWDLKFMLGMSATPFRTDKLKIPFNKIVQDAGIHRLIQDGWLSQYQHWCIEEYNPQTVAQTYMDNHEQWGKTCVFFHQLTQCEQFNEILASNGIRAEVVRGDTSNIYREKQLDAFDNDEYDVIINVAILTEGFDCPNLKTVFCRDSAKLPTIQMAGRGFRIHENKTHCNIVQSKTSKWQFTRTAKPTIGWVQKNNKWLALGNNIKITQIAKTMINTLVNIETEMPEFIVKNRKKRRVLKNHE